MKKLVSYLSIAAMILVAGACNKQEQPDEDSGKLSDLQYLIDGLVRTDEAGNITGYMVGDCLNEADPWDISVPVNNYDEAAAIFRDLLPDDAQVTTSGKTLIWAMTDEEGKPEATAEFVEDPGLGAIAAMTVKPVLKAGEVKQITPSVHFILTSTWPQNAGAAKEILERDYYLGATVIMEKNLGFGSGSFVVIRPWSPSECGIMIKLKTNTSASRNEMSSVKTLHKVHKALYANYDLLVNGCGEERNWPSLDRWYMSRNDRLSITIAEAGFVNLKTNKEKWVFFLNRPDNMALAFVYFFKPDGDKIKFW